MRGWSGEVAEVRCEAVVELGSRGSPATGSGVESGASTRVGTVGKEFWCLGSELESVLGGQE